MNVIGHEDISVDMTRSLGRVFAEQRQVDEVVGRAGKAGAAIISPLDDVEWYGWEDRAWRS
jgi:hypothetical protein